MSSLIVLKAKSEKNLKLKKHFAFLGAYKKCFKIF